MKRRAFQACFHTERRIYRVEGESPSIDSQRGVVLTDAVRIVVAAQTEGDCLRRASCELLDEIGGFVLGNLPDEWQEASVGLRVRDSVRFALDVEQIGLSTLQSVSFVLAFHLDESNSHMQYCILRLEDLQ